MCIPILYRIPYNTDEYYGCCLMMVSQFDDVRCQDSAKSCIKLDRGMPSSTGSCCCRHRFCRSSSFRFSRITTSLTWARSCSLRSLKSGAKPLFLCSLFGARGWQVARTCKDIVKRYQVPLSKQWDHLRVRVRSIIFIICSNVQDISRKL